MIWIFIGATVFIGIIGSSIVQGIGWERLLKFLNYETFGKTDPYFGIDISFYLFVLPFIKFVLATLLSLMFFYLLIVIAAYSVFHIYMFFRRVHILVGVMIVIILLFIIS